jgi:hypothetical protein
LSDTLERPHVQPMNSKADMRILIVFGGWAPGDAVLAEGDALVPAGAFVMRFSLPAGGLGHVAGCACCAPRGPAAAALAAMFRARATGAAPFFGRVVVVATPAGEAAVRAAVAEDVVAAARFMVAG